MHESSAPRPAPIAESLTLKPPTDAPPRRDKRLWAGGAPEAWTLQPEQEPDLEAGVPLPPKKPASIPRLKEMIMADPRSFAPLKRLVDILVMVKRFDQANLVVDRAIARKRNLKRVQAMKVYVLSARGDADEALAYLRGLPEGGVGSSLERALIEADVLIKAERIEAAEAAVAEALRMAPEDWQARRRMGHIAVCKQEWARAVELLEPLLEAGRPLGNDALLLGACLIETMGEFDRGFRAYASLFNRDLAADRQIRAFFEAASLGWIRTNSVLNIREAAFSAKQIARLEQRLQRSMAAQEPLALIRLLDGEGRTFDGSDRSLDGAAYCNGHIEPLPVHEMERFQGHFLAAVKQADILGLPNESMVRNPYNRAVINHLDGTVISRVRRGEVAVSDQPCHFHMQMAGSFERLLRGREFVGVISGRDVTPYLTQQLGVGRAVWHPVPGQARHDGLRHEPHYPARFEQIRAELDVPHPGAVYLVGAGIVGKVYCAEIKRRGGIAIDIGAIADVWAGRTDTRPFLARNAEALSSGVAPVA